MRQRGRSLAFVPRWAWHPGGDDPGPTHHELPCSISGKPMTSVWAGDDRSPALRASEERQHEDSLREDA